MSYIYIYMYIQRQKLLIAVFEPASWDPSPEELDRSILSTKRQPKSKIDILAETGLAVTDDGLEATWSKAQRMPLLEA